MHDSYWVAAGQDLLIQSPLLATLVAGLAIAWGRWVRHPRESLLATIALALLLAASVGSRLIPVWLGGRVINGVEDARRMQRVLFLTGLGTNLAIAAAVGLLLWAAFRRRPTAHAKPIEDRGRPLD